MIIILQVTPQSAHPWHVVSGFKLARADLVSGTLPIRLPSDSGHIYISSYVSHLKSLSSILVRSHFNCWVCETKEAAMASKVGSCFYIDISLDHKAHQVSGLLAIFLLVLVGVFQGLEARANPEADAEPEAEANPDADPDAQYGSGSYVDVADENGGQGYYPGEQNGGQGYYPGGQNGGQGYYPGDQNGGQGYYPGGGSYPPNPGMPGGNGGGLPPPYAPIQPGRPSDFVPLDPGGGFQDPDFGRPGDFQDPGFSRLAIARPIEQPDFITPVYGSGGQYPGGSGGQGYNPGLSGGQGYNPGGS